MPTYNPEFLSALQTLLTHHKPNPKPVRHDITTRRTNIDAFLGVLLAQIPRPTDVTEKIYTTPATDGHVLNIHHFYKTDTPPTNTKNPAIYYIHGGGYIALSVPHVSNSVASTVSLTGVQCFAIEYRLAPEHPFPTPLEDCYTGFQWLLSQSSNPNSNFNIDPARIGVMGDSAGGGLAAALCIAVRDRMVTNITTADGDAAINPIKKQILIYPMLDHTNVQPNPDIEAMTIWTTEDNITGWAAYLGLNETKGNPADLVDPPVLAVPGRVESVVGLPPLYIDVGTLDNFRDEDVKYATRFMEAGLDVELHLYYGLPHAFTTLAREAECSRRAVGNRIAAIRSL